MSIGTNISLKRKEQGWTQKQLSERLHVSDKTISSWETERTYPDISALIQLSETFDLSLDQLIKGDVAMVKSMDKNIQAGRNWKRWRILFIGASVLIISFVLLNLGWLIWRDQRQAELDRYPWSQVELPEQFVNSSRLYVKKKDLYIFLSRYETKTSTPYLKFENGPREISVQDGKKYTLVFKDKNDLVFYNGNGSSLSLNKNLEPVGGLTKTKVMTTYEQKNFLKDYRSDITRFYKAGLPVFEELNN
ncbi:hypothetical protein NRIC_05130 [Enterococcus florum]|uniref:HTH cro/C1-type domain-containing protein n=1 Tax=Enterococcus florum TaxID=2480627 RepID=A0A4P5PAU7_9ENTE|nr:helix-turn-helix transcriptional regulator [Enterococcus florum]GCF92622.1 hypothetical protein NRIC_05130 [Enterococcus florum]